VTEGSEPSVSWDSVFASRDGEVEKLEGQKITIKRTGDGHRSTRPIPSAYEIYVKQGDTVRLNQVIAGLISPLIDEEIGCSGQLPTDTSHSSWNPGSPPSDSQALSLPGFSRKPNIGRR